MNNQVDPYLRYKGEDKCLLAGELTDKATPCAVGSLLPSASADGQMIVPALPVPLWVLTPFNTIDERD